MGIHADMLKKKNPVRNILKDHLIAGTFVTNVLQSPENPHNDKRSLFLGMRQPGWEAYSAGGNTGWTVGGKVPFLLV